MNGWQELIRNFVKNNKLLISIVCALSFLFASSAAIVHEHKDDKIHDDCPLCIFKISNNIDSSGKPLPKIPKAIIPKPIYIRPYIYIFVLSKEEKSRSPPLTKA